MTDITETIVDLTITALEATLQRALERYDTEETEYAAKRDAMVQVAHRRGTANGIGPSLDDLLEEFGLARRPWRGALRAAIRITAPVADTQDVITTSSGYRAYRDPAMTVSWPWSMECSASLREGDTCLCSNVEDEVRTWMRDYYGTGHAPSMTVQVGPTRCAHHDCPNRDSLSPGVAAAAAHDWSGVPSFPAVIPEVVAA